MPSRRTGKVPPILTEVFVQFFLSDTHAKWKKGDLAAIVENPMTPERAHKELTMDVIICKACVPFQIKVNNFCNVQKVLVGGLIRLRQRRRLPLAALVGSYSCKYY
jgi:hypothetical protein